ncbi:MAG TPA: YbhB/YbcL family Raf kinase inhibitor-like protein [Polyangiaceae bacterium]|nr:YbhB/YbcL family Raf kinase inhibitor-like protein [Polyangiaceae bacterium]
MSSLKLTSTAFAHQEAIPPKYTCEGADTSPPLAWSGAPAGTQSFALVVDDPDAPDPKAPKRTWVHWVLADIPPSVNALGEGAAASGLPAGTVVGKNDWGKATYGGPCPPIGRHRYFHKLYALDRALGLANPTKADLERAMKGHVLGEAVLVGTYEKKS